MGGYGLVSLLYWPVAFSLFWFRGNAMVQTRPSPPHPPHSQSLKEIINSSIEGKGTSTTPSTHTHSSPYAHNSWWMLHFPPAFPSLNSFDPLSLSLSLSLSPFHSSGNYGILLTCSLSWPLYVGNTWGIQKLGLMSGNHRFEFRCLCSMWVWNIEIGNENRKFVLFVLF